MSACISRHGEYSSHKPDGKWVCKLCGDIDHYALVAEVERLRADVYALTGEQERAELWREKANQYHARLAAVEALAAEWERENRRGPASDGPATAYLYECAADLRAALETDTTKEN